MLCAVAAAADALVVVGGPLEETTLTVICVEFAAAVLTFVFRSVAEIVAVALAGAAALMVTMPSAATVATALLDELNDSAAAGSACTEPSLYVPETVSCADACGASDRDSGCSAMEHKVSVAPRLTRVALAAAVVSPEAESVAVIMAVAPVAAPH